MGNYLFAVKMDKVILVNYIYFMRAPKLTTIYEASKLLFFTREYVVLERVFILLCCCCSSCCCCCCCCCCWDRLFYYKSNFTMVAA
jgi:hypothetical protein